MHEGAAEHRAQLESVCARNLFGVTDEIIYFKDLESRFILLSRAWSWLTGRDPEELLGLTDFDVFGVEHAANAYADEQQIIATGAPIVNKTEREVHPDRPDRWVTTTKLPLRDDDGRIIGTFGISRDITRLVEAEAEARRAADTLAATIGELGRVENQLRTVLDTSPDGVSLFDTQLRYQYVNAAGERLMGNRAEEVLGRTDREVGRPLDFLATWEAGLRHVLDTGQPTTVEMSVGTGADWRGFEVRMAAYHATDGGPPVGVVTSTREITQLKLITEELAHQAVHDPVTGLANRVLLMDRLGQALRRAGRRPGQLLVLFIDLDGFKQVNDVHGHTVGDGLLVRVAHRLSALTRDTDTVARFGGDEFVLLCEDVHDEEVARLIAERVVEALREPFADDDRELSVSASVGVVMCGDPGATAEELIRDADIAMYQAKERGRNRYQFFDADLRQRATVRYATQQDLTGALEHGQLRLEYQPVHRLRDRRLVGAEALIRWDHPTRGNVRPDEFIEVAEACGLIVPIGEWALDEACRQLAAWSRRCGPTASDMMMAVNVSGRQLRVAEFAGAVKGALDRHSIAADRLCLEITETALLDDPAGAREVLAELAALGVQVALDDFGTGYSSLARVVSLPVDIIKIDRSFVAEMERNDRSREVVVAVTAMAHALGMRVIGEGIETATQLTALRDLGCDDGQGYLFSRPLRPEQWTGLLDPETP